MNNTVTGSGSDALPDTMKVINGIRIMKIPSPIMGTPLFTGNTAQGSVLIFPILNPNTRFNSEDINNIALFGIKFG